MKKAKKDRLLLACGMLRDEIEKHLAPAEPRTDVVWMQPNLHEYPEKLRAALQQEINGRTGAYSHILLAFGLCGNGALGLKSDSAALVLPRFDDCIRMMLSHTPGQAPAVNPRCLYYTRGWIDNDQFLLNQFEEYHRRYGKAKTKKILQTMYKPYTHLHLVETGAYDMAACRPAAEKAAAALKLSLGVSPGSTRVIEKLLSGDWDEEFCIVPAGVPVTLDLFFSARQ